MTPRSGCRGTTCAARLSLLAACDHDAGNRDVIVRVSTGLSAIDWLPDGRMLLAPFGGPHLLRQEPDGSLVTHADLTSLSEYAGTTWLWTVAATHISEIWDGASQSRRRIGTRHLALVSRQGSPRQVANNLYFPNGVVVTPENATLIIAELRGRRLTALDINPDGSLSNRRLWAEPRRCHTRWDLPGRRKRYLVREPWLSPGNGPVQVAKVVRWCRQSKALKAALLRMHARRHRRANSIPHGEPTRTTRYYAVG